MYLQIVLLYVSHVSQQVQSISNSTVKSQPIPDPLCYDSSLKYMNIRQTQNLTLLKFPRLYSIETNICYIPHYEINLLHGRTSHINLTPCLNFKMYTKQLLSRQNPLFLSQS